MVILEDLIKVINEKLKNEKDFNIDSALKLCKNKKDSLTVLTIAFNYSKNLDPCPLIQKEHIDISEKFKLDEKEVFFRKKVLNDFGEKGTLFLKKFEKKTKKLEENEIDNYFDFLDRTARRLKFVELFGLSRVVYEKLLDIYKQFPEHSYYEKNKKELNKNIKGLKILEKYSSDDFEELMKLREKIIEKNSQDNCMKNLFENFNDDKKFSEFINNPNRKGKISSEDFENISKKREKTKKKLNEIVLHDDFMKDLIVKISDKNKYLEIIDTYRVNYESLFGFLFFAEEFEEAEKVFPYINQKKELFILTNHAEVKDFSIFEHEFTKWFIQKINHIYENGSKNFAETLTKYLIKKNDSYGLWNVNPETFQELLIPEDLKKIVSDFKEYE